MSPVLIEAKEKLLNLLAGRKLLDEHVEVRMDSLSVEQAIGTPVRQDFPLLTGREVMVEAAVRGSFGQAFTECPTSFSGKLSEVLDMGLQEPGGRTVFVATLNAVMRYLGIIAQTRHCRDEEPEECAGQIACYLKQNYGGVKVGIIGFQPAILESLADCFGADRVQCGDLNPGNIGKVRSGVRIADGEKNNALLIDKSDVVLVTGSSMVNGTFDAIRQLAEVKKKKLIVFGVTGRGVSNLLGLESICFRAH